MDDFATMPEGGAYEAFLLNFVEECNAVIAEILRLLDFLPMDFVNPSSSKYKRLLIDFEYFAKTAAFEKELAAFEELQDNFYSTFGDVLISFEVLFQTVANLLLSFVEYTHQISSDSLTDSLITETKELEVEALASVASVVLHFDRLLKGPTRERIFVAIYRNSDDRNNVEFLVDFLRQEIEALETLFPGEYMFHRIRVDPKFVENCIQFFERVIRTKRENNLRRLSDRLPVALFGCFLFAPKCRESDTTRMKYFVDNFFRDHWVISLSLGLSVSVADEWDFSAAARTAMRAQFTASRVKELGKEHYRTLAKADLNVSLAQPEKFESFIEMIERLNSSLKWMVLHTDNSLERRGREYTTMMDVTGKFVEKALDVTLKVAVFEIEFAKVYESYISQRKESVGTARNGICAILSEMAELFSSGFASIKLEKRTKLRDWLLLIKKSLEEMDLEKSENSQLVQQIKRRLVQVGEMLDLGGNLAMAHFLEKVHQQLDQLSAGLAASEEGGRRLAAAANAPYLWRLVDGWIPAIQSRLLQSGKSQTVRVFFSKLAVSIAAVCDPLQSTDRKHLIGRAYSCYLERRLRNVLQSIPHHLFATLHESVIPALKREWAPTIDKAEVKELASFTENFKLSEVTYNISNMSIGISRFSLRKLGTIDVNPKELLEDGIRRELRSELPKILTLTEKESRSKELSLEGLLSLSSSRLSSFHRAFIYMCDHVGVASAHDLWREEILSVIEGAEESYTQPLPKKPLGPQSVFPIVFDLMMKATNPLTTIYQDNEMVWRDKKTRKETFSARVADSLEKWIPCFATTSLESSLAAETEITIKALVTHFRPICSSCGSLVRDENLFQSRPFEVVNKQIYTAQSLLSPLVAKVGQLVLLRSMLVQSRREHGRLRATPLFSAIDAANQWLLCDVSHLPSSTLSLVELSRLAGLFTPTRQLAPIQSPPPQAAVCLLSLLIHTAAKFNVSKRDSPCEQSWVVGLSVVLRHLQQLDDFSRLVQLLSDSQLAASQRKAKPLSADIDRIHGFAAKVTAAV